jgi:hypothetical protein
VTKRYTIKVLQVAKTREILLLIEWNDKEYVIFDKVPRVAELFLKKNKSIQFGFEDLEQHYVITHPSPFFPLP